MQQFFYIVSGFSCSTFHFFCLYDEFFLFSKYFLTSCIESETQWVKLSDVENSFEGVVDLIVKSNVSTFVLSFWEQSVYLMKKKTHSLRQLAAVAEQYLAGKNKKLSSRDFNLKKSACALRPIVKNADASSATRKGLKYFNCRKLGLIKVGAICVYKVEVEEIFATSTKSLVMPLRSARKNFYHRVSDLDGNKSVIVIRGTFCSGVIVQRFGQKKTFNRQSRYVMMVTCTLFLNFLT